MKKIAIAAIALLFLASVFVGFRLASQMSERFQSADVNGENNLDLAQHNYLIFHFSDFTHESNFLVSVWGLFINYTEPPHLAFVALYPLTSDDAENRLNKAFKLRRDASIPDRLIAQIERQYDIETDGYILVDNFAVSSLEAWLGNRSVKLPQQEPVSTQEFQSILLNGEDFFSTVCSKANNSGLKPVLDEIRWSDLLPEHFSTSLSFEELMLGIDTLTSAENIDNCEVFISQ